MIFDPIGYTSPCTIQMKILLQKTWLNKVKWDQTLPEQDCKLFKVWCDGLQQLTRIRLPRVATGGIINRDKWQVHIFTDASAQAYAAAIFLRVEDEEGKVKIQLLAAKSRVAPLGGSTIPRLELLGCLIGARLFASTKIALQLGSVSAAFWSDSTTALAWIMRNEQWGTIVGNRTEQIGKLTDQASWRFVNGEKNPADLPSRGCSAEKLTELKWWEGPSWLYESKENWPISPSQENEEEINKERKKSATISFSVIRRPEKTYPYRTYVRVTGWILRFCTNSRCKDESTRTRGDLTELELEMAEGALIRSIQCEVYPEAKHGDLEVGKKGLKNKFEAFRDDQKILRVKTRLTYRDDLYNFKFPFILPGGHPITQRLIWDKHCEFSHAGAGFLVAELRKKYWIVHARRSVKHVIDRCYKCRRYKAKPTVTPVAGLPEDRVKSAEAYEICGVDLAGPLLLKNKKKVWLVIFTCALYRAVHLDLVTSVSTPAFIRAMHKFVQKYRRPGTMYSDNGTNFKGADNFFGKLNWQKIMQEEGLSQIVWKFNCSTASWWGGWWERLIRTAKELIRRNLGNSQVTRKEMDNCLAKVEDVMNGRPLTYLSEDPADLEPLTPNMFIRPLGNVRFPEMEYLEAKDLRFRLSYVQTLKNELQERWRREYLAMLVAKPEKATRRLTLGEMVVVNNDKKRHEWDLARIVELFPGKDGIARVAKIRTTEGEYVRPVQRLHPLEVDSGKNAREEKNVLRTRAGRIVKRPARYQ